MATKPYPQKEETTNVVQEPVVAYQAESKHKPTPYVMESLRRAEEDYKAGRVYTEEEMDKVLTGRNDEWLKNLCKILGKTIRTIGDTFNIITGGE